MNLESFCDFRCFHVEFSIFLKCQALGRNLKIRTDFHIMSSKLWYLLNFIVFMSSNFSEKTNEKHWDHSKFTEIRQRLDDCNYVKYSMYRVALKFRVLQNLLFSKYLLYIYYI